MVFVVFLISIIGLILVFFNYKKNTREAINKLQLSQLAQIVYTDIPISYSKVGAKIYPSLNNSCDIYIFNDFIAINRRTWIFSTHYRPLLICNDTLKARAQVPFSDAFNPDKIYIKEKQRQIFIKCIDPAEKNLTHEITLKDLSDEQLSSLGRMKSWIPEGNLTT